MELRSVAYNPTGMQGMAGMQGMQDNAWNDAWNANGAWDVSSWWDGQS